MYLVFDIGGTHIRMAFSEDGKVLLDKQVFDTPKNADGLIEIFTRYKNLHVKSALKLAVGCVPGIFNLDKTQLSVCLNIPYLEHFPLIRKLGEFLGCDVLLENDAVLAALGESVFGAGSGNKIVAYLTIGSGVGGARVIDGEIDVNSLGFEPGYQVIDVDGSIDKKFLVRNDKYPNNYGYLQRLISGEDIKGRFFQNPSEINDPLVWQEINKILAFGINNTIVYWSPDIIVLGGSVAMERLDLHLLQKYVKEISFVYENIPPIKIANLGDDAGLYGALARLQKNT